MFKTISFQTESKCGVPLIYCKGCRILKNKLFANNTDMTLIDYNKAKFRLSSLLFFTFIQWCFSRTSTPFPICDNLKIMTKIVILCVVIFISQLLVIQIVTNCNIVNTCSPIYLFTYHFIYNSFISFIFFYISDCIIRIYTFIGVHVIMLCCFSTLVESLVTDTDVNEKMINFIVYFMITSFHIDGLIQQKKKDKKTSS